MALKLGKVPSLRNFLFEHSSDFEQGLGTRQERIGKDITIVAEDNTGDFTDIQEAINHLPSSGGVIYIKEGNYKLQKGIIINKANTKIFGAGSATNITAPTSGDAFEINGANNCHIEAMKISLTGGGGYCVDIVDSNHCTVKNIWTAEMDAAANIAAGSKWCIVTECHINNTTGDGILVRGDENIVTANVIEGAGFGVWLAATANKNVTVGNVLSGNTTNYEDGGTNNISGSNITN